MYDNKYADGRQRYAAIVLGAFLSNNNPSPALQDRLNTALQLYRTGKIDKFILSGGLGKPGVNRTEAEAMKEYLERYNIPAEKMILEGNSHNTKENLQNTASLLDNTSKKNLYLVTNDFHMKRALLYAKLAGLTVSPAPAHSTALFLPYHKLRECVALIKLYLFDQND
jgi:uncharacterized SAM-binding protein YcdF (DUF218 family)